MESIITREEARHSQRLAEMADAIAEVHEHRNVKTVLVSGPTSSGKTTFSERLCGEMRRAGLDPMLISVDDYFVDRERTPRDADGGYDFEAIECVDTVLLNSQLRALAAGESVTLPYYDFVAGKSCRRPEPVRLKSDSVIVLEGIHALNPALVPTIPDDEVYRIFIACFTAPVLPDGSRVATSDVRLLRRITRDNAHRGYPAESTLAMWGKVRRGEERNILPYQGNADTMFDSSLAYELGALRPCVEPLLRGVGASSPQYAEAQRLLRIVEQVAGVPAECVPAGSLLREFVGC